MPVFNRTLIASFILLLLTGVPVAGADELKVTASEWPPYVGAELYRNGVALVLTEEALQRSGHSTVSTITPWPAALDATVAGHFDVLTSVWFTAERAETLAFSEPFMTNYIVFTKRDDNYTNYNERADLEGQRIGVVADYAYSDQPYDTTGIDIELADSVRKNIERLLANELDLVLADGRVAAYEINQLVAAKTLTVIRNPLSTRGLRMAVSKQHPDHEKIVAAFNASIEEMRADGSYNAILATFRISE